MTSWLLLGAVVSITVGCGGEDQRSSRGNVVITPAATPAPDSDPATDQSGASTTVAATTPPEQTTPAEPPPTVEAKPEPTESAEGTAVAAATPEPAATSEPAVTPEPAATAEAGADKGTTFRGRVVVKGDPPPAKSIKPSGNDAYCINLGEIPSDEVLVGEGNGLANVFVWVRRVPSGVDAPEPPAEPAVLDQKNCRFIPPALVVQVGQTLLVKNDDATLHNTRMSGLTINFNQTVGPNNRDGVAVDINRAEIVPVPVKCDIHGWMSARVLATDNPWHAITDKNGHFEINHLPAGTELEFRLQHGLSGYVEKSLPLTFSEGEVKEQVFEVDATRLVD